MHDDIVFNHFKATAALLQRGLDELRDQVGFEARDAAVRALQRGAHLQAITSLSMAGALHIKMNLVSPTGEVVNLGEVQIDSSAAMPAPH